MINHQSIPSSLGHLLRINNVDKCVRHDQGGPGDYPNGLQQHPKLFEGPLGFGVGEGGYVGRITGGKWPGGGVRGKRFSS